MNRYRTRWARAIGRRLDQWQWSQTMMAEYLGEAPQRVHDWLHGKSEPSDAIKPKLIERLQIDPQEVAPDWLRDAITSSQPLPPPPEPGSTKVAS